MDTTLDVMMSAMLGVVRSKHVKVLVVNVDVEEQKSGTARNYLP